jgi:hypothetical protein
MKDTTVGVDIAKTVFQPSVTVTGTGKNQVLHIESRDVIGGSVPFFVLPGNRHGLKSTIADVLG